METINNKGREELQNEIINVINGYDLTKGVPIEVVFAVQNVFCKKKFT